MDGGLCSRVSGAMTLMALNFPVQIRGTTMGVHALGHNRNAGKA